MYSDENNDQLVNLNTYNNDGGAIGNDKQGTPWRTQISLCSVTLPTGVTPDNEVAQQYLTEMGFKQPINNRGAGNVVDGPLYKYCKNPDAEHCPGDKRYQLPYNHANGGQYSGLWTWDSYTGAEYLNGEDFFDGGKWNLFKRTQITRPSDKWVWAEGGDMRGENLGSWDFRISGSAANDWTGSMFMDSPAAFHITSAVWNFADGHAEGHKWLDGRTVSAATSTSPGKDSSGLQLVDLDCPWVAARCPGGQNP